MAGGAALAAGCGPMRSFLSVPTLPGRTKLTWLSLAFSGLFEPAARVQDPLRKLQQALAALEEDKGNPNGPAQGNYTVTPILHEYHEPVPRSWSEYVARLVDLPVDLLSLHAPMVQELAHQGAILPLDQFMGADGADFTQEFFPFLLDAFRYKGSLYALPIDALPLMLYYDLRYFETLGVPPVDSGWTWDTLVESAVQLTQRNEEGVTQRWGLEAHRYGLWWALWQNQADIRDPDSGECRLNDPAAINALEFYRNLLFSHRVTPPVVRPDLERMYSVAANSWPAMFFSPRQEIWSGDYRWAAVPQGKVRSVPVYSGMSIALGNWTENTEAAYTALKGIVGAMQEFVNIPAKREAVARLGAIRRSLRPTEVVSVQESMAHGRILPQRPPPRAGWPAMLDRLSRGDAAFELTREAAPRLEKTVDALVLGEDFVTIVNEACS
jgi:hypothetical protein